MIDLHTHSAASDGHLSPADLIAYAQEKGLQAIALTDHDTVEGLDAALKAGRDLGLEVIPGIEISAVHPGGTMHILGYFIDHTEREFLDKIEVLQLARKERNPKIIQKLQALGIDITMKEVEEEAGSGQVGRPHFAKVLYYKGHVKNTRSAFKKYLKQGACAYVDKFRFQPEEAIELIRNAGGIPVLAHPSTLNCKKKTDLEELVAGLVDIGLMGLEVYYPDHKKEQVEFYTSLAAAHSLRMTGGSDFHGKQLNGIDL
ncbi:MAG: PHP domain-containing protein, partial [Deltaproteobacteria bacterium]|nr:PHP domain-containing protein [Deltaproteobacteria bacterium]